MLCWRTIRLAVLPGLLALTAPALRPAVGWGRTPVAVLEALSTDVLPESERHDARDMLRQYIRQRLQAANDQSSAAWRAVRTREDWERFIAPRRAALDASLGSLLSRESLPLQMHVTRTIGGDGLAIDNVVFNSRPGLWITANLYRPVPARQAMPGILICHSHHTPKTHGELQDMGMTWARLGCLVLVMDQFGHGERRTHPFATAADYPEEFRVSRQDYYFRYDNGIQLHLAGESLVGQFAWDLRRGVDLLLAQPGIDHNKIALLGSVAGGGDPAAVAGMLDQRIAAVVPFNFGGPQPETRYPLPDDAETSFHYAGSGSWEFLPWVIVAGIAPRRLVFAHEFNWDQPRDPVWRRLETVYQWFEQPAHLAYTTGRGELSGRPPEATHCTHIGMYHRRLIHAAFAHWFEIRDGSQQEYSRRINEGELMCWTDALRRELAESPWRESLAAEARRAANERRGQLRPLSAAERNRAWQHLLGGTPSSSHNIVRQDTERVGDSLEVTRVLLETDPGIRVPLVLLRSVPYDTPRAAAIVLVAQSGKQAVLRARLTEIADMLRGGALVCLPDLRGVGETRPDEGRERQSSATSLSSSALMLGDTMLGMQVRDLRGVLQYLRRRGDVDAQRLALWGDSLAEQQPADRRFEVPHAIDGRPVQSEPLGGLATQFTALLDGNVRAVVIRRGLTSFASVLDSPVVAIPHDVVLPGILPAGDVEALVADLAPIPVCFQDMVNGQNRPVEPAAVRAAYGAGAENSPAQPVTVADRPDEIVPWLLARLRP
jgi:dienelactone hydrolase